MAQLVAVGPDGPRAMFSPSTAKALMDASLDAERRRLVELSTAAAQPRMPPGVRSPLPPSPFVSGPENRPLAVLAAILSKHPTLQDFERNREGRRDLERAVSAVLDDPNCEVEIFSQTGRHFHLSAEGAAVVGEVVRLRLEVPFQRFSAFPMHAYLAFSAAFRERGKEGVFSVRSAEDVYGEQYLRRAEQLADAAAELEPRSGDDWRSPTGTDRLLALVELGIAAGAVKLLTDPRLQLRLFDLWSRPYPGRRGLPCLPTYLKFVLDIVSYVLFLAAFTVVIHQKTAFIDPYPIREIVLGLFVVGFAVSEVQQLRALGWTAYRRDPWNIADLTILAFFAVGGSMRLLAALARSEGLEGAAWVVISFNAVPLWVRPLHIAMMSNRLGFILTVLGKLFKDFGTYLLVIVVMTLGFSQVLDALVSPPEEALFVSLRSLLSGVLPQFVHAFFGAFDFGELPATSPPLLAPLVMMVYMACANILLLNLLIASFSSTYKSHAGNAKYERCLSFSRLVTAYAGPDHNLPPPLNILEFPLSLLAGRGGAGAGGEAPTAPMAAAAEGRAWTREALAPRPPEPVEGPAGAPAGRAGQLNRVLADAVGDVSDALRAARKQRLASASAGPPPPAELSLEQALKRLALGQRILVENIAAGA